MRFVRLDQPRKVLQKIRVVPISAPILDVLARLIGHLPVPHTPPKLTQCSSINSAITRVKEQ